MMGGQTGRTLNWTISPGEGHQPSPIRESGHRPAMGSPPALCRTRLVTWSKERQRVIDGGAECARTCKRAKPGDTHLGYRATLMLQARGLL